MYINSFILYTVRKAKEKEPTNKHLTIVKPL